MVIFEKICKTLPPWIGLPILLVIAFVWQYCTWLHEDGCRKWLLAQEKDLAGTSMNFQVVDYAVSVFTVFVLLASVLLIAAYLRDGYLRFFPPASKGQVYKKSDAEKHPPFPEAKPVKLSNSEKQGLRGETDKIPGPESYTSSIIEKMSSKQRIILSPVEDDQDETNWLDTVEVLIQEGVKLKNDAGKSQYYYSQSQKWIDDYYNNWQPSLLSAVRKQYGADKSDFVKRYEPAQPKNPEFINGLENRIAQHTWHLDGQLEWLYSEREKLKTRR